jgi:hypothetical protein
VRLSEIGWFQVFERVIGSVPYYGVARYWDSRDLIGNLTSQFSGAYSLQFALALVLSFALLYVLVTRLSQHVDSNVFRVLLPFLLQLICFGLLMMFAVSVGFQSSQEVQGRPLSLGSSARDSLYMSLGFAFVLAPILLLLAFFLSQLNWRHRRVSFATIALVFSIMAASTSVTNSHATNSFSSSGSYFVLERFSREILYPDLSEAGDPARCADVRLKLGTYPEWLGHDALLVNGINASMKIRNNIAYCSISETVLFEDYPK